MIPNDNPPPHALFIQPGKFKAGAFGIPAVVSLSFLAVAILAVFAAARLFT